MRQIQSNNYPIGESLIERLPSEILHQILIAASSASQTDICDSMSLNIPDLSLKPVLTLNLFSCLLTSRALHTAALPVMYRHIKLYHPSTFHRALAQIAKYPALGNSVRTLDLSNTCRPTNFHEPLKGFNPVRAALHRTPLLREFRIGEIMEQYLDFHILEQLFCDLPYIRTLDLSGCNSPGFVEGCIVLLERNSRVTASLSSLSLAKCSDLSPEFFELILPQLPMLRYLDVSNTQITSSALSRIPATANLSHFNVSHCYLLGGIDIADFLMNHPATKQLVHANMETHSGIKHQIFSEEDVSRILSTLPPTLRTLHLENSAMNSTHVPLLRALSRQLEELSVGAQLWLREIESLFFAPESLADSEAELEPSSLNTTLEIDTKYASILTPMEEAISICKVRQRINSVPFPSQSTNKSVLKYLNISSLPVAEQCLVQTSILLGPHTGSLGVIEISEKVLSKCGPLPKLCAAVGWELRSVGRRCWLRRKGLR